MVAPSADHWLAHQRTGRGDLLPIAAVRVGDDQIEPASVECGENDPTVGSEGEAIDPVDLRRADAPRRRAARWEQRDGAAAVRADGHELLPVAGERRIAPVGYAAGERAHIARRIGDAEELRPR